MDRPTAAPPRWPYREHRNMAQVMAEEVALTGAPWDGVWCDCFWPHIHNNASPQGHWVPSRFDASRNAWQLRTSRTVRFYVVSGTHPKWWRPLVGRTYGKLSA